MIHWHELSTDQRIEAVRTVWKPGMSAGQIAEAIPCTVTRNAIIGVMRRHADKLGDIKLREVGNNGSTKTSRARSARKPRPPVYTPKMAAEAYDATALRLPLHELTRGQCKWPVNDVERGGVFLFCGHKADTGPYCQDHRFRAVPVSILSREGA